MILPHQTFIHSSFDIILEQTAGLSKQEGDTVSLSCSYTTSSPYAALYWYRHHPGLAPQYILYRDTDGNDKTADFAKGRFTSQVDKNQKHTTLSISSVIGTDAATYYCGLTTSTVLQVNDIPVQKPPKVEPCSSVVRALASQTIDLCLIPSRAKYWATFLTPHTSVCLAVNKNTIASRLTDSTLAFIYLTINRNTHVILNNYISKILIRSLNLRLFVGH
uniref:Ig-like domain-containing protein n=1 Tax=Callorhinchus milii TaxID=7868 RepID=A0A4W3HE71_CALMI